MQKILAEVKYKREVENFDEFISINPNNVILIEQAFNKYSFGPNNIYTVKNPNYDFYKTIKNLR